jgi:hypothetical protein
MTKFRTSRLTRAAAVSALCAAAFTGLAAIPAQAAVNTQDCAHDGATVVGKKCQLIGAAKSSRAAALTDAHTLSGNCYHWNGKPDHVGAADVGGGDWAGVVECV